MGEIVNLRRARKRAARVADAASAQQNRVRFGRTPAEKRRDGQAQTVQLAQLDGKRLDPPGASGQRESRDDCDCEPAVP